MLNASAGIQDVPTEFVCPITQEVMVYPVITSDGYTYERSAIRKWLMTHDNSPMTNLRLDSKRLIPNYTIRTQIDNWKSRVRALVMDDYNCSAVVFETIQHHDAQSIHHLVGGATNDHIIALPGTITLSKSENILQRQFGISEESSHSETDEMQQQQLTDDLRREEISSPTSV
jgi:hypothetical protein